MSWERLCKFESATERRSRPARRRFCDQHGVGRCPINSGVTMRQMLLDKGYSWSGPSAGEYGYYNISFMLDVARDMEEICPDAWLIQAGNPVYEGCTAMTRQTEHQGLRPLPRSLRLSQDLRPDRPGLAQGHLAGAGPQPQHLADPFLLRRRGRLSDSRPLDRREGRSSTGPTRSPTRPLAPGKMSTPGTGARLGDRCLARGRCTCTRCLASCPSAIRPGPTMWAGGITPTWPPNVTGLASPGAARTRNCRGPCMWTTRPHACRRSPAWRKIPSSAWWKRWAPPRRTSSMCPSSTAWSTTTRASSR